MSNKNTVERLKTVSVGTKRLPKVRRDLWKLSQSDQKRKEEIIWRIKNNVTDLWDTVKQPSTCILEFPEALEDRGK